MITTSRLDIFRQEIEKVGLTPPATIIADGTLHRFASNDDRNDDAGWYVLYGDGLPAGSFGDWRSGLKQNWCAKADRQMSATEREEHRTRLDHARSLREADEQLRHVDAAHRAQAIWNGAAPATGQHPYLHKKGIRPHGLRVALLRVDDGNRLVVPVTIDSMMTSLQFISSDGTKRFLRNGVVKGGSYILGDLTGATTILICEGFATGASLHEATDLPVIVAFNAGNLLPVARALRETHSRLTLLVCADDDVATEGNPGLTNATEAADAVDARLIVPDFGVDRPDGVTDFNDLANLRGLAAVKQAITTAIRQEETAPMREMNTACEVLAGSVSGMSVPDVGEWLELQPIKTELLPVEPLRLSIVPLPFRAWVKDVSERMQCPPDYMAAAMLVMTSSIIGAGCGIRPKKYDDWLVIPNLWGGVVGRPSMMKTPAIGEAMKPLDVLSTTAKQDFDGSIKAHLAEMEAFKAQHEAIQGDMRKAARSKPRKKGDTSHDVDDTPQGMDDLKKNLIKLEEPAPPVWRRYVTNDATIEKMAELQASNPRGLMLFRDELVGLYATWDKDGHEADRAFYLEGWNGDRPHTSDRIGRGTTHVSNLCVSLFGGIQPTKLTSYLHAAMRGQNNDGLVQRLQVLVYPDEPDWTLIDRPVHAGARQAAFQAVERLSTMDFRLVGAVAEEGQTPYFRFADDTQDIFNDWLTELQTKLRTDEEPVLQEHLGKYRSLMPSLALIFHLVNLASVRGVTAGPITRECAEQAAAWCEYLETHARRVYGMVTNLTAQAASRLARKLEQGELPHKFTVRDVYRKEWSLLSERQVIENACEELTSLGWLREHVTPSAPGQKGKTEYIVNPKVRP